MSDQTRAQELRDALLSLRRVHHVSDDCWYSCPQSGECCDASQGQACNCGADEANATIDKALALLASARTPPEPKTEWRDIKSVPREGPVLMSDGRVYWLAPHPWMSRARGKATHWLPIPPLVILSTEPQA